MSWDLITSLLKDYKNGKRSRRRSFSNEHEVMYQLEMNLINVLYLFVTKVFCTTDWTLFSLGRSHDFHGAAFRVPEVFSRAQRDHFSAEGGKVSGTQGRCRRNGGSFNL